MRQFKFSARLAALTLLAPVLLSGFHAPEVKAQDIPGSISVASANPAGDISPDAYVPIDITPKVQGYEIEPGLSNIENLDQFPNLTQGQTDKIVENGFVVSPSNQEQLFYIYEDNTYKKVPTFVTTDSVLQVYHIFYDYILRTSEVESFLPAATELNKNMLNELIKVYDTVSDPLIKQRVLDIIGYFGVAQTAFSEPLPENLPDEIFEAIKAETKLINAAEGRYMSPLFEFEIDYSLFVPRGHYTRSDILTVYFKGMSWYGVAPFPFYDENANRDVDNALRAMITAACLNNLPYESGLGLWESVYGATSFFVGQSDDITPSEIFEVIENVYADASDIDVFADNLDAVYAELDTLRKPLINSKNESDITGIQMRFMGQRYIPDSEIMQELAEPIVRPFPSGLDVMAVLGSERAAEHLERIENPSASWPGYTQSFEKMREKFDALPDSQWQSNLYYAWLYTLKSLLGGYGEGYPTFMRSAAWEDKSLATALGSWAELRHDTILYGKQSGAECGGGLEAPVVYGYVEPSIEVYNKLLWMTKYGREQLTAWNLLNYKVGDKMESFDNMLSFLLACSVKELNGEDLDARDYDQLLTYGGWLEYMTSSLADDSINKWYLIESETDKNMAVIADVHSASDRMRGMDLYLEEAVGTASEIYVVFPVGDKLYLGRGAVFDYYEFVSDERLTDEAWQERLKTGAPARPEWTDSYIEQSGGGEVPTPPEPYSTGC